MQNLVIAFSEDRETCTYPKGCYFDYATLYQTDKGYVLKGKGRYGCLTEIVLSDLQAKTWINLKKMEQI